MERKDFKKAQGLTNAADLLIGSFQAHNQGEKPGTIEDVMATASASNQRQRGTSYCSIDIKSIPPFIYN